MMALLALSGPVVSITLALALVYVQPASVPKEYQETKKQKQRLEHTSLKSANVFV